LKQLNDGIGHTFVSVVDLALARGFRVNTEPLRKAAKQVSAPNRSATAQAATGTVVDGPDQASFAV